MLEKLIRVERCFTRRLWVCLFDGAFAVGFGPRRFVERVQFRGRLIFARSQHVRNPH